MGVGVSFRYSTASYENYDFVKSPLRFRAETFGKNANIADLSISQTAIFTIPTALKSRNLGRVLQCPFRIHLNL